jgi:RimJ/RimL family protein N-acetyltransferase
VPFDRQPTLTGPRLLLRPLTADDWQPLYAVASDPLIWEQHPQRNRYELDVFRTFFEEALASGGALVAIDRANGLVVGSSRFHGYDEAASEIEIGWSFLSRLYWGGVYNGEMKRLMLEHAFQSVDSVIFVIGPNNRRSQKAVQKLGAVLASEPPPREGDADRVVYRLTKDVFRARPA